MECKAEWVLEECQWGLEECLQWEVAFIHNNSLPRCLTLDTSMEECKD